jgi:hypothetical protein
VSVVELREERRGFGEFTATLRVMADSVVRLFIANHTLDWSVLAEGIAFQITFDRGFASTIPGLVGPLAFYPQTELNRLVRLLKVHEDDHRLLYEDLILMKRLFVTSRVELREPAVPETFSGNGRPFFWIFSEEQTGAGVT